MRLRFVLAALVALGLVLWLGFSLHGTTAYAGGCVATYTVQRGDNLTGIAGRFDTSVSELLRLNGGRIRDPNLIYTGQMLCLPSVGEATPGLPTPSTFTPIAPGGTVVPQPVTKTKEVTSIPATQAQVALEVTYRYTPSGADGEDSWNLTARGGYIGKRLVYPLQPISPVVLMTKTEEIAAAILGQPAPVLLAVRNSAEAMTYTLVYVGEVPPLLSSLRISKTEPITIQPGCNSTPVTDALGGANVRDVRVTLWLEARETDGKLVRYPFSITHLNYMPNAELADMCYGDDVVGLALLPADSGQPGLYRNLTYLNHEGTLGPSGYDRIANCARWRGKSGWFYHWLRSWYGCMR